MDRPNPRRRLSRSTGEDVMASLIETLIETIAKDLENLENMQDEKARRKEASLIRARIESALRLAKDESEILKKLNDLKDKI